MPAPRTRTLRFTGLVLLVTVGTASIAAAAASPAYAAGRVDRSAVTSVNVDAVNCSHFADQSSAQGFFDGLTGDPYDLDGDRDLIACEKLLELHGPGLKPVHDLSCGALAYHDVAQLVLRADPSDPHDLDGDGDGNPCEKLWGECSQGLLTLTGCGGLGQDRTNGKLQADVKAAAAAAAAQEQARAEQAERARRQAENHVRNSEACWDMVEDSVDVVEMARELAKLDPKLKHLRKGPWVTASGVLICLNVSQGLGRSQAYLDSIE